MKEISIKDISPFKIGQTENSEAGTGCTVVICEDGMHAGIDIRGAGPASREVTLMDPLTAAQVLHAVVLGGGSAFGLGAADGVMKCLEERGIGFDVGVTKVPLVAQSDIFDLTVGDTFTRPDREMGYKAATLALDEQNYKDGNYGVGCGATVGKTAGMETCMKSGIGSYAIQAGSLKLGAIVVVNALGDVFDSETGQEIAGLLNEDKTGFKSSLDMFTSTIESVENRYAAFGDDSEEPQQDAANDSTKPDGAASAKADAAGMPGNTTLAVIMTNAAFTKPQLCKIAGMAHDGYARSIKPIHTTADGDSIYAVSSGDVDADQDVVGSLAAEVVSKAITRAIQHAETAFGYPAARDL